MGHAELPTDLPPLDVTPGPSRAEPLPGDRPVRWGILATGKIAGSSPATSPCCPSARSPRSAPAARSPPTRSRPTHGAGTAYGDYRALVEDPAVDVVYVATPHALHREHVELAFEAGKPVLCEKAFTLDAADAEHLVALAREKNLFLMEAMWMRCNPLVRRLQQLLATGALGEVRQVRADLGFVVDKPPTDRLLDPALGGGALLDMGVYPLTFAQPVPRRAVHAGRDRRALGGRRRPEPRAQPRLRQRRGRLADLDDDRLVAAHRVDRHGPRPDRPARPRSTTRRRVTWTAMTRRPGLRRPGRAAGDPPGADRHRPVARGARGGPLPAQRRDREPAGAAGRHRRADAADGPDPRPDRGALRRRAHEVARALGRLEA